MENNIDATWRRHLVFGGTAILQHTESLSSDQSASLPLPPPPDHGCLGVVTRTGFGTSQGGLMRKILFATERVTANSMETFYFIAILIVFAIGASALVLHGGLKDESRNKFRLVLHCIMIITSVIPPELPMELSLAVTNSLAGLSHLLVFCTEPFRIPLAGKLNVLCFDKTGTLTKDKMILKGVVGAQDLTIDSIAAKNEESSEAIANIVEANTCSDIVVSIMAGCHSLMKGKTGNVMGDPMELVSLEASGFSIGGIDGTVAMNMERKLQLKVKHRYPFSSALKRMSVIVDSKSGDDSVKTYLFTKGAPEIVSNLIVDLPMFYKSTYLFHMNKGKRVLTIAYKEINTNTNTQNTTRADLETGLTFAGFLIFDCDLKADSKSVIRDLKSSNHKVIMITG
jgi:cation-transporting ATPase 13A1